MIYLVSDIARSIFALAASNHRPRGPAEVRCLFSGKLFQTQTGTYFFNPFERRILKASAVDSKGKLIARHEAEWGL